MTISSLASKTNISPNTYGYRGAPSKITIHHTAGVISADGLGWIFSDPAREASCNYGIGNGGEIICILEEEYGPWTSSSYSNDIQAVTFEVSNSYAGDPWPIGDDTWNSMIRLAADICNRWGIVPYYDGTPNGTFTEHRMFAATGCPGEYIHERMYQIVEQVKAAMGGDWDEEDEMAVWTYKNQAVNGDKDAYQLLTDIHQAIEGGASSLAYKNARINGDKDVYQLLTDIANGVADLDKRVAMLEKK